MTPLGGTCDHFLSKTRKSTLSVVSLKSGIRVVAGNCSFAKAGDGVCLIIPAKLHVCACKTKIH